MLVDEDQFCLREFYSPLMEIEGHILDYALPEMMINQLPKEQAQVPSFKNGNDLVQLLIKENYDGVVLNRKAFVLGEPINPSIVGEIVAQLKEQNYQGKIIVTTSEARPNILENELTNAGVGTTTIVKKVYERQTLLEKLAE